MNEIPSNHHARGPRSTGSILVIVVAIAILGFILGLVNETPPAMDRPVPVAIVPDPHDVTVITATPYWELPETGLGPTRHWVQSLQRLIRPLDDTAGPIEASKDSFVQRSLRRAYAGAPPVIPHAVNQLGFDSCISCHGESVSIGGKEARPLPHPYLENCLQCHGTRAPDLLGAIAEPANTFVGSVSPSRNDGPPPTLEDEH